MKIIVLHGEDIEKSYQRLQKFIDTAKERSWEVVYIDESPLGFKENISSTSLFGNERFFILTDLQKLTKNELDWLKKTEETLEGNLIIYHEGDVSQTLLKALPKTAKIEEYKLPKLIWSFLEHLTPGNSKKVIFEFHKIIEKDAPEFVFALIAKQFRNMYWAVKDPLTMSLPSWQVSKIKSQASKFQEDKLKSILEELAKIDVEVKTGKADLVSSLDLLILANLK